MLEEKFNDKQVRALLSQARILILYGAKRTGKTFILLYKFLLLLERHKNKNRKFVLGGATLASIRANILDDLEILIGYQINLNKYNNFRLLGNTIMVRPGSTSDAWKGVRGFTAYGAFLNEGTALHDVYVKEVISRCSGEGAEIYIDTNPENPMHFVKTDYVDKSGQKLDDGRLNIEAIHFELADNTFLDPIYVESIKLSTPSGMFYERDILGRWVSAEGVVYKDFNKDIHVFEEIPEDEEIEKYIGGIDYGFGHYGSIVVIAKTVKGNYYLIEEVAERERYIDWWTERAKEFQEKYKGIIFYCDYARTEHISYMKKEKVRAKFADKSVVEGINHVGSLLKRKKLFFLSSVFKRGLEEMYLYAWSGKAGKEEVTKTNDDVLDAIRYAIFSQINKNEAKAIENPLAL